MFEKKFKVRVNHYTQDKYTVDWTNYRFIPTWHNICWWYSGSLEGNTHRWAVKLFSVKDAENFASTLKSIEDLYEYYGPEKEKEKDFYKERNEYYEKNVPYKTKVIK